MEVGKINDRAPTTANADDWLLYLSENTDALPMVAVQIAEAIEAAQMCIWAEFVAHCEALENEADRLSVGTDGTERGFWNGQRHAAKSTRCAVPHPKYARRLANGESAVGQKEG